MSSVSDQREDLQAARKQRTGKGTNNSGRPTKAAAPKKMGRPSGYSQEVADKICAHIASGGYATGLERFGLPSSTTINRWVNERDDFRAAYARARESRAETFAEQIVEIADTEEDPQRARVRVEARKWVASKLFPRMYGEAQRVEVEHTLSATAAQVLQDLTKRARDRQAIEGQVIDVTPQRGTALDTQATDIPDDSD